MTKIRSESLVRSVLILPLVACMALSAVPAAAAPSNVLAEVDVNSTGLIFYPIVEHAGGTLTVSLPDRCLVNVRIEPGDNPIFKIFDPDGQPYGDGVYRWELRLTPRIDEGVKDALADARGTKNEEKVFKGFVKEGLLPLDVEVQVGAFNVIDSRIVDPGEQEPGPKREPAANMSTPDDGSSPFGEAGLVVRDEPILMTRDFVINDDLIVDGSACIGFDCVNGESFGFDTVRLKENNLRIKFDDTSVAASFPAHRLAADRQRLGQRRRQQVLDRRHQRQPYAVHGRGQCPLALALRRRRRPDRPRYFDAGGRAARGQW